MMRSTFWAGLGLGAVLLAAPRWVSAAETNAAAWEALFNGRNLDGWVAMNGATGVATNGCLRLVAGLGWLRTAKPYQDFVLETEWRALEPDYDSGLFIRAGLAGQPWPIKAWQVDLQRGALGALVKGNQTMVPAETPPMPLRQWVKFRLEVRGKSICLDVNGERAWQYDQLDAASGYLGIEAENKAFEFRNLRLLDLRPAGESPSSAQPPPKEPAAGTRKG